ncbi:MAG TPA: methyltransferase [Gammaproteobacteria bacterium]|nr:methyltransferase [Gammaproteobacteria bacterium]
MKKSCRHLIWLVSMLTMLAVPAIAPAANSNVGALISSAMQGNWRSDAHKARDKYRHPKQTLEFFGLQPGMMVVELWPGGGWYTEILAPVLHDRGKLIAASVPARGYGESDTARKYAAMLAATPAVYGKVKLIDFMPPGKMSLGADGSADMVLTFRNLHNWQGIKGIEPVFQSAFRVLKHGGVFGVVEHRAPAGKSVEQTFHSGYMPVDYVIREAEQAGFKLVAQSEINANPKDTKDYPKGVWTLPPSFTLGDKQRAKYTAIGESDRMTLKFVKP